MRALAASLILCLSAAGARADVDRTADFCKSLTALRDEAVRSGKPQDVAIIKAEAWTFACRRDKNVAAQVAFCAAASERVGLEFTHGFPWYVYDCLKRDGVTPNLETADQYTGLTDRKKIRRLTGVWRDGVQVEILFKPLGDYGDSPTMKDYWGEYRLMITPR